MLIVCSVSGIFIKTCGLVTTIIVFKFEAPDAHTSKILPVYYIGADVLPEREQASNLVAMIDQSQRVMLS